MPIPRSLPRSGGASCMGQDSPKETILANRYRVGNKLGSGSFGSVYLVTDLKSIESRKILKKISVGEIQPNETVEAVREAALLAQLDHPAIVKFHDSFLDGEFFCIVTECCEGGDLDHMITKLKETGRMLDESLILDWFVQLTNAIWYIHSRRVLHRDIKTRNIFLKDNRIKLGDFGISRILMGTADYATTFIGTPYYMSPEVLKHEGYNTKSDIWSLGVVLYELCTLEHAFHADNVMAVMYRIVEGETPQLPDNFTSALRALCSKMMDKDPKIRPSAVEILQDTFIKTHMEKLNHKLTQKLESTVPEAAHAIARVLSPVRMHQFFPPNTSGSEKSIEEERPLTPREKMLLRKSQKADQEAERIRAAAAQNYIANQQRYNERKKKTSKTHVVPPWVEEHPEVFGDPSFSTTTQTKDSIMQVSHRSFPLSQPCETPVLAAKEKSDWDVVGGENRVTSKNKYIPKKTIPQNDWDLEEGPMVSSKREGYSLASGAVGGSASENVEVPDDPQFAESHYTECDHFEEKLSNDTGSESDDDYKAIIGFISEALELPDQAVSPPHPLPGQYASSEPSLDDLSPFSPLARERRISILKVEAKRVLGEEVFLQVYEYLKAARYRLEGQLSEAAIMEGLKTITNNTRDCFIVDQLVFLEKKN